MRHLNRMLPMQRVQEVRTLSNVQENRLDQQEVHLELDPDLQEVQPEGPSENELTEH